jgi:hypothetical protein
VRIVSIANIARWADAVIALEARGPLPTRIVLVPSEAHAHALRVELVARGPQALAGTRFFTAAAAARAVLDSAGVAYRIGEEARRPLRLRKVFRGRRARATYRVDDLRTTGWEAAFAATIEQLELAALRPDDLDQLGEPRASDLAAIWRAVDQLLVRVAQPMFESDEAIVAILGHEMHELNNLRRLFEESGGAMTYRKLYYLINPGIKGNLHDQAWDVADALVAAMRKARGAGV